MEAVNMKYIEILKSFYDYTNNMKKNLPRVLNNINIDDDKDVFDKFIIIIDGLKWCGEVIYNTQDFLKQNNINICENDIADIILKQYKNFENEEYQKIIDVFRIEVLEIIIEWNKKVGLLLDNIE